MFTAKFWVDALERAIKTMAQFLLASGALDPLSADLQTSLQTKLIGAVMAGVVSILTSVVSSGFGQKGSASVIDARGDDGAVALSGAFLIAALVVVFLLGLICGRIGLFT